MTKLPLPPGLHLIPDGSAGGIFNRNYGSRQRLVEMDNLGSGPTPRCSDWASWRKIRIEYWQSIIPPPIERWDPGHLSLYDSVERLRQSEIIHIWAATSL